MSDNVSITIESIMAYADIANYEQCKSDQISSKNNFTLSTVCFPEVFLSKTFNFSCCKTLDVLYNTTSKDFISG